MIDPELLNGIRDGDTRRVRDWLRTNPGSWSNDTDEDGFNALINAIITFGDFNADIAQALVDAGCDVNASESGRNWTALHFAARYQNKAAVELLLNAGACVSARDVIGNTPLIQSLVLATPNTEIVELLLRSGANPRERNDHGVSALDVASANKSISELLQQYCK